MQRPATIDRTLVAGAGQRFESARQLSFLPIDKPNTRNDGPRSLGGSPVHMFLYVQDVDAAFERAIKAGATELMPVEDSADGDRRGGVTNPFGHVWYIATHVEGISREELQKRYAP